MIVKHFLTESSTQRSAFFSQFCCRGISPQCIPSGAAGNPDADWTLLYEAVTNAESETPGKPVRTLPDQAEGQEIILRFASWAA